MPSGEKLEVFTGAQGQDFDAWYKKFDIHLRKEKLTVEDERIDELFFYLKDELMKWFLGQIEINSLPKTLKEIKEQMDKRFGKGSLRPCKMANTDVFA